jgi:hypothetical protein
MLGIESEKSKEKKSESETFDKRKRNCICTFSMIDRKIYFSFYSFLHKKSQDIIHSTKSC